MKRILALIVTLFFLFAAQAQVHPKVSYKIKGKELICIIDRDLPTESLDSLLGTCSLSIDSLEALYKSGKANKQLWRVEKLAKDKIILVKPLDKMKGQAKNQRDVLMLLSKEEELSRPPDFYYGINNFSKPAVVDLDNGLTRFYLKVEGSAPESVFLAGSFNEWSTSATALSRCDSGYFVDLELEEGPHLYKYIVNGYWLQDPRNQRTEYDFMGNANSIYFKYNYRFFLKGFGKAKEVFWASSVNDWSPQRDIMHRCVGGWELNLYLREGTHAYKYIVDDKWILDPENPVQRQDDEGNLNSFVSIGDTFYFYYPFDLLAQEVHVTGNFNLWSRTELSMEKTDTGWVLPYVLPPGNYEYKYIVDQASQYKLDPLNPLRIGNGDLENSVISIEPNTDFFFPALEGVNELIVTGSFSDWREDGYKMYKERDGWHAHLHLPKGKNTYRFIVNGKWQQDPSNPYYEPNEFDEYNSVIWIK